MVEGGNVIYLFRSDVHVSRQFRTDRNRNAGLDPYLTSPLPTGPFTPEAAAPLSALTV